ATYPLSLPDALPISEHAIAVVQLRAVHEVDDHLTEPALEDRRGDLVGAQRNREVAHHRAQPVAADVDLPVARQHDADVVAEPQQLLGKRSRHVGNAAQLGERRQLGGRDENFERRPGLGLGLGRLAWYTDAERAAWGHDLDVPAFPADDQRELEGVARALAK